MREFARLQTAILLRRLAFQMNRSAKNGDADAIHDLRVAIRRFSRCLKVFTEYYPEHRAKRIRHQLSALMSAAGSVRDRDIVLGLLAQASTPPRAAIIGRMETQRRHAAHELLVEIRRWKSRSFSRKWRRQLEL